MALFIPKDQEVERIDQLQGYLTTTDIHDLIYDYITITDFSKSHEHTHAIKLDFECGTELLLDYEGRENSEYRKLTTLPSSGIGLSDIQIKATVENPLEAIDKTFSDNPSNYTNLPFQTVKFKLKKDTKIKKIVNPPIIFSKLIYENMSLQYTEEENHYNLTEGEFCKPTRISHQSWKQKLKNKGLVAKLKGYQTTKTLGIYQILPFSEKQKEILTNIEEFEVSYRFARPNDEEDDSGHLFDFKIKENNGKYELTMDLRAGFLEGLDLESAWPARNLFTYLSLQKKLKVKETQLYGRYLSSGGWRCRVQK